MLGFIGTGNMGAAILRGVLQAGLEDVVITRANSKRGQEQARELGVGFAPSNSALMEQTAGGVVILAVKPAQLRGVLTEIRPHIQGHTLVSVAAGVTLAAMEEVVGKTPLVRVMPNVAAAVGASMSALSAIHASASQIEKVREIFSSVGAVAQIEEADFPAFTALAGCSPAWTFSYVEALAQAGLAAGLKLDQARYFAVQAVHGAAELLLTGQLPNDLKDQVTSPGGTTIAGLAALNEHGMPTAVDKAVQAAIARDLELGGS